MVNLLRTCIICGETYTLDPQEVEDGTYSPLCTDCLRRHCEMGTPVTPEIVLGEKN